MSAEEKSPEILIDNKNEGTVFVVLKPQQPWPPINIIEMLSCNDKNGVSITLTASPCGNIVASFTYPNSISNIRAFDVSEIEFDKPILIMLQWCESEFVLKVNEKSMPIIEYTNIMPGQEATKCVLPRRQLILPGIKTDNVENESERFLLESIADLDQKIAGGDRYSVIRASGLMRQLLIEGLILRVAQRHGMKLTFRTNDFRSKPPVSNLTFHWINLNPTTGRTAEIIECNDRQFRAAICIRNGDIEVAVNDVIKACANAKGGVHFDTNPRRSESEQASIDIDQIISLGGEEPCLAALSSICDVFLQGSIPLVHKIQGNDPTSPIN